MRMQDQGGSELSTSAESFALEHTPTWAVAAVCVVFIALSLLMQRGLQRLGNWLLSSHKKPLYEALEKMKEELMLLGFISLLLTAAQNPMSRLCMPASWSNQMLPCHFYEFPRAPSALAPAAALSHFVIHRSTIPTSGRVEHPVEQPPHIRKTLSSPNQGKPRRRLSGMTTRKFCSKDRVPVMSTESLHQLHIFIFVMAVVHVFYSCFTMLFGFWQLRSWRKWEEETKVENYNYTDEIKKSFNEEAFRKIPFRKMGLGSLRRQSTFVTSRTMTPWSTTTCGIWFNSFFRQFGKSVSKSDYLTLRLGFIKNHNAPMHLNFHKYIMNSLEDDLKTVIGIRESPWKLEWNLPNTTIGYLWLFVIFFMILNVHGWYAYFWMSFIPVLINLVIGAKLQHVITQLAMETAHAHGIVAVPIKPRDELFWFNNPHLLLYLIHFVLFQNAFELAFCIWLVTTFGFNSCFFAKHGFIISRVIVGILAQVLCSYSTLPLYALVSQMGSHYKRAIFADPVSTAVTDWRNKAKANIRQLRQLHKKELEHETEAEGGATSDTHCHTYDRNHDHGDVHHHHCSSTLVVTSDGEIRSQAHHDNFLTHPAQAPSSQMDGTKADLVRGSVKSYCGQCESLGLTLQMDTGDCEGNAEDRIAKRGPTCSPNREHLLGSAKTKAVYVKISSEDTTDGPLEPAETTRKHSASKGPSLDRMRRLPSREIREMRIAEATYGVEPFRPDLHIPELMMCTTHLNVPRLIVDFAKSTSFSSGSEMASGQTSHSSIDTQLPSQAVIYSHASPSSEVSGLRDSSLFTTGMASTNSADRGLRVLNHTTAEAAAPTFSNPRVDVSFLGESGVVTLLSVADFPLE